ncbi:MAG: xanthine dehydrogenase family protein subunit M [Kiritimatiellae bacterium]|nr:xanthine dehydrogenase family protein subunit M [Kiritimatiellia bacterium]
MHTLEHIDCLFPATLKEALTLLADEATRGRLLAGGTDLLVQWQTGVLPLPERAISLVGLQELKGISESGDDIVAGALTTHAELRRSELVRRYLPALAAAAATIGGAQIQAQGTIAGNVANASPAGDLAPALLITGGRVVVAGSRGERTIPLESFFLGYRKIDSKPDELIARFILPKLPGGHVELFRKLGPRAAQAISKVMAACRARAAGGRIESFAVALGSVAPTAVRLKQLELWIAGKPLSEATIGEAEARASAEVAPIDDIRSTAEYRKWVSGRLVRGFLEQLA